MEHTVVVLVVVKVVEVIALEQVVLLELFGEEKEASQLLQH